MTYPTKRLKFSPTTWKDLPYRDGRRQAEVPLNVPALVKVSKRGDGSDCLLQHGIMDGARKDLEAVLGHPVLYAFVDGGSLYIVSKLKPGGMEFAMGFRYGHNQVPMLRDFDKYTRRTFLRHWGNKTPILRIQPPRVRNVQHVEAAPARPRPSSGEGQPRYQSRGAMRRMEDAGLIHRRMTA
jgi:hypothetical protein